MNDLWHCGGESKAESDLLRTLKLVLLNKAECYVYFLPKCNFLNYNLDTFVCVPFPFIFFLFSLKNTLLPPPFFISFFFF